MPDIKIVDRHCALNRVSGRFIEANHGHDQEAATLEAAKQAFRAAWDRRPKARGHR